MPLLSQKRKTPTLAGLSKVSSPGLRTRPTQEGLEMSSRVKDLLPMTGPRTRMRKSKALTGAGATALSTGTLGQPLDKPQALVGAVESSEETLGDAQLGRTPDPLAHNVVRISQLDVVGGEHPLLELMLGCSTSLR